MSQKSEPKLLSSGNPQIQKGDGDAPVQAWIAAMPGWKTEIGRRIDQIVMGACPTVKKAVKWNTPLYGNDDGWFLAMYCYKKYVQLTFFRGTSLNPVPPVASKTEGTRYFSVFEDDTLDETQIESWIAQAARLPGVKL